MNSANSVQTAPRTFALEAIHQTFAGKVVLAVAASAFVALAAHVSVPLPFTPVPLTLGNMAVIMVGLALGPATALAALMLYLAEGALGLPVFNPSPLTGVAHLLGPNGGFLFAYPAAAALASMVYRGLRTRIQAFPAAAVAATLGTALVLLVGVCWLAVGLHLAPMRAFMLGAAPFIPGEIVKIASAAGIVTALIRFRRA